MTNFNEGIPVDQVTEAVWRVHETLGADPGAYGSAQEPFERGAPPELYSGMAIPDYPARTLLEGKLTSAFHIDIDNEQRDPRVIAQSNAIADSVCEVEGITMIEPGDYGVAFYRCAQYAFGTVDGREWARSYVHDITMDFWNDTTNYLLEDGYELVDNPQEGDIIVYAREPGPTVTEAVHVGVLGRDGKARAKFNQGPIVEHPIELVPGYYGSYLYFFRRKS